MQRRYATKPLYLIDRKITHPDGTNLPLVVQGVHRLGGLFDRNQWVGPVNLIDIDVIGSQPAQGVLDFLHDARPTAIARNFIAVPLKSCLRGNNHVRAQLAVSDGLADDLFGSSKSVAWSRIDDVDAMLDRATDRCDGFRFVGSTPHPPANGPGADRNARHFEIRAGDVAKFHIGFEKFSLSCHDLVPL